jgi:hypothetical protein
MLMGPPSPDLGKTMVPSLITPSYLDLTFIALLIFTITNKKNAMVSHSIRVKIYDAYTQY